MSPFILAVVAQCAAAASEQQQAAQPSQLQQAERVGRPPGMFDLLDSLNTERNALAAAGIQFGANYTIDGGYNFTGGAQSGGFVVWLLTAGIDLDLERVASIKGGQFVVTWQSYFESNPGPYTVVPDWWGYEGLSTGIGDVNQLSQCYYQQLLLDDALAVIFGKQDACNNFLSPLGASNSFIHTMAYFPAPISPYLPTYPDQAMGLVITGNVTDWLTLKSGWFDGTAVYPVNGGVPHSTGSLGPGTFFDNPGSWFFISEAQAKWKLSCGLEGTAAVGGWWQTGPSVAIDFGSPASPQVSSLVSGWYAQAAQFVWTPAESSSSGVQLFGSFGWSSPAQNPAPWSIAGGCVVTGLVPGREADSFGAAIGYAGFSDSPEIYQATQGLYEFSFEAYYNFEITPWMTLQPDIQVVTTPGIGSEFAPAIIGMLRLSVNF